MQLQFCCLCIIHIDKIYTCPEYCMRDKTIKTYKHPLGDKLQCELYELNITFAIVSQKKKVSGT